MWLKNILFKLFPGQCLLCGQSASGQTDLCHACYRALPSLGPACQTCARPLAQSALRCGQCLKHPPVFDQIRCPFYYRPPISQLIQQFKFDGKLSTGQLLAQLLASYLQPLDSLPQLLLPVPLSPQRLRQRGFNQAVELARLLSPKLGLDYDPRLLSKIRHTPDQVGLSQAQRQRNLRGAFQLTAPVPMQHLVLIDDVVTTGATANELARLLKAAGVNRVDVWCLARTP